MPANWPASNDTFSAPTPNVTVISAALFIQLQEVCQALEETLGLDPHGAAADVAARLAALDTTVSGKAPTSHTHANGYGPNYAAAADAPTSVKNAVTAAGGTVCDGTADNTDVAGLLSTFGEVVLTQGSFNFAGTVAVPGRRILAGSGSLTEIVGASGLSGDFFTVAGEHTWLRDFTISGSAEAASTNHVHVNVTSSSGFTTGADACVTIERLVSRNAKGDGIIVEGTYARESKIVGTRVWNATGRGYHFNAPDGRAIDIIAGTCGGHGVELGSSSSNWHVSGKSWYSDGDGFRINGVRHTIHDVEAQDNALAGFRILGNYLTLTDWLADSNSYSTSPNYQNWHSGLEIGLNTATAAGTPGSASGGYKITIGPGQSWDKNEGSRGYYQRHGVLIRSGARHLVMVGVNTGDSADTHYNATSGITFLTAGDKDHANNHVVGCLSDGARVASA